MIKKSWAALALVAALAFSPHAVDTALATAGWQKMNSTADEIIMAGPSTGVNGTIIPSGGGDYKVQLTANGSGFQIKVELWEDDGLIGDDLVDTKYISSPGDLIFSNIGNFVDGDKAEFYIKVYGVNGYKTFWYYYD